MKNSTEESSLGYYIKWLVAGVVGVTIGNSITEKYILQIKKIPNISEVQPGFAVPSKLEIVLQDLDSDGQKEVVLSYDGKNYLLTVDEQGRPRIQTYEIKPTTIIRKE